jgi:TonB family protein
MSRRIASTLFLVVFSASLLSAQVRVDRVRVSQDFAQTMVVNKVAPIYPEQARKEGIQGNVQLLIHLSKEGDVESVQVISGQPLLAASAIEAVKQWKYKPYLMAGFPYKVETQVTVSFTLSDKSAEVVTGDGPGPVVNAPQGIFDASGVDGPAGPVPNRVRVSQAVESAMSVKKVPPVYPPDAKDQGIQGAVVMAMIVDKQGNVANLRLISGHPVLVPAAIEAVKQWKYKPYLLNQTPVEVETQVQVNFTLLH